MLLIASGASASGRIDSGAYRVHYSAVNSTTIPAVVARRNGIERDDHHAVVMITLHKPTPDNPLNAVPANVSGNARDLIGNKHKLTFRQVENAGSRYALADVPIRNDQTLTFRLRVGAADGKAVIPVEFNQTFVTP